MQTLIKLDRIIMVALENEHEELFYLLALTFVNGVGSKTARTLMEKYGEAKNIFNRPLSELKTIDGIGEVRVKAFKDQEIFKRAEEELNYVINNNIVVMPVTKEYPKRLYNCLDAPLLLFSRGNFNLNSSKIVAIVGTRRNTDYGLKLTEDLIDGLQNQEGLLIVSGLALGIDAIAHKKCVQLGIPTVGVFGHGLDRVYPYTHKDLVEKMVENGGVLAEFPSGTLPDKSNFPMRNRIVAGLSDVTVVVESNLTGGALITASMAAGYNREVMAFPGRINDTRSAGCNEIIRTNLAAMITKPDDLLQLMNWDKVKRPKTIQQRLFITLTEDEQKVIDLLQEKENMHSDELLYFTGLASSMLAATLLQLEMQGLVKTLPGKFYRIS